MPTVSLPFSLIAAAIVLLIPGGAVLAWFRPRSDRRADPITVLVDASALSLSISALVGLAGNLLGLRFLGTVLVLLYGVAAGLLVSGLVWRWGGRGSRPAAWRVAAVLAALALTGILLAWRLYQARELALPPWVDSVHHTLVTRVMLERGGVPDTLDPYLPVPLAFHYGFMLAAALFAFWSGSAPDQAVLWFGQLLNALVALAVYRAAAAFLPASAAENEEEARPGWQGFIRRLTPLIAALLVGFAFQMPAYYLTWGRFTLLAGLVMLGPAMAAALDAWEDPRRSDAWLRLVLTIAGMALTHILALLLIAFFLALLGIAGLVRAARGEGGWDFVWRMAAFSLLGLLLAAPWLAYTLRAGPHEVGSIITVALDTSDAARQRALDTLQYLSYLTGPRRSHILLGLAGVGVIFALLRPRYRFLAGWALLTALFTLPWGTRASPFRADYFAIVLFFPAALLLSMLLAECGLALGKRTRPWAGGLALLVLVGTLIGWGIWETRSIINPVTVIATPADARALDWVSQNTPPDARFYTNSALWIGTTYRGVDGGYWLMPYSGRFSLVPPAFYDLGAQEYENQINDWARRSTEIKGCTPEFWQIVREANLTHVYLREGIGGLQPTDLAECPLLHPVYQEQGVHIYSIRRQ